MRRRTVAAAGAAVAVLAGGTATALAHGDSGSPDQSRRTGPPATTEITRADLVDSRTVTGTLDYAGRRAVNAGAGGTITKAPVTGREVARGGVLYSLNARPVVLLYGPVPAFRAMRAGTRGPDVRQLEQNLSALGYGSALRVDDTFDNATAAAVKTWQRNRLGIPRPSGALALGDVVFLRGTARVAESKVALGDLVEPGRPVLMVSGERRIVRAELEQADERLAVKGAPVTVELPGRDPVRGRIAKVARPPVPADGQENGGDAPIRIEIALPASARSDQRSVQVKLVNEERRGVLTVPVEALVALSEGGHGLQIVENGRVRTVAVEPGLYADGRVEVAGDGLREGVKVGTVGE
ncbi:peptidoglycan-binding protein [Spirillospora sp. NPDC050679]